MERQVVEIGERELRIPSKQVHNVGTVDCPPLQRFQCGEGGWVGRVGEDATANDVSEVDKQERMRRSISGLQAVSERFRIGAPPCRLETAWARAGSELAGVTSLDSSAVRRIIGCGPRRTLYGGQSAMDLSKVEHLDGQGQIVREGKAICPARYDIDRVGLDASGKPIFEGMAVVPSQDRFNPQVLAVLGSGVEFVLRLSTGDEVKVKLLENLPPPPTGRYKITVSPQ
jgi:hypothetical protein